MCINHDEIKARYANKFGMRANRIAAYLRHFSQNPIVQITTENAEYIGGFDTLFNKIRYGAGDKTIPATTAFEGSETHDDLEFLAARGKEALHETNPHAKDFLLELNAYQALLERISRDKKINQSDQKNARACADYLDTLDSVLCEAAERIGFGDD